jgi:hypothetical protein
MYEPVSNTKSACDLCGEKPGDGLLYRNEKHLLICADCKGKLEDMPRGMRENLENYLLGNVV